MMNDASIRAAVREAKDFLKAAATVTAGMTKSDYGLFVEIGKDSGALRRASMDLTRALAEMRRPS